MSKSIILTAKAPSAIGIYSQAVKSGNTVYMSGQIALDPATMEVVGAADIGQQIVKLNIYLTDLGNFQLLNEIMSQYFNEPYPARAAVGVAALPKGVGVEMDAVLIL